VASTDINPSDLENGSGLFDSKITLRLTYILATLVWFLFLQSAIEQVERPFYIWLVTGRGLLLTLSIILLFSSWSGKRNQRSLPLYFSFAMMIQSSFATLEPPMEAEFYKFVPYFLLLSCLAYSGTLLSWNRIFLLPTIVSLATPLFSKAPSLYSSIGRAVFSFTEVIAVTAISFVVLRLNIKKHQALMENLSLKEQLLRNEVIAHEIARIELEKTRSKLIEATKFEAIAQTTQMLAHDVRKPFNLFRMTMDRVKSADTPEQMKAILNEAVPEVDRSLASVNGLISDVLNVGAEGQLELKPIRLAPVVDDVVDEVRKLHPKSRLDVKLDVPSELWVQADFTRIPRVFLNILSNAVEAVGAGGHPDAKLWVSACEVDGNCVEVRVGNAGSYIAPENLDKLFDLFFTSGKTGGTGLGLAIVKKIVTQHGGTVHCTSERNVDFPNGRVEFVFTLGSGVPVVEVPIKAVLIDAAAAEVSQQTFEIRSDAVPKDQPADVQKPQVIFLDDSPLARWAWENKLKAHVSIRCFDGPKAFFQKIDEDSSNRIDLCTLHTIITDHYFTPDERLTGLELARELRNRGFTGRILLASNGEFSPSELNGIVDKIVDKQPVDWERLPV
jgi:signal transduction histidine kinase